jgi:hypothetical protein
LTEGNGGREKDAPRDDEIVEREEARAADEAGAIGGRRDDEADPATQPVEEAGGGVAEGFELSEEELREQAEHGEGHNPLAEAGELEDEDAQTEYSEPDRLGSASRTEEEGESEADDAGGSDAE